MLDAKTHYEQLLARHYSRAMGGFEAKAAENGALFDRLGIVPRTSGRAVDMGAGSGFQSLPLAERGFSVTAVDFSPTLVAELSQRTAGRKVTPVLGDIRDVAALVGEPAELAVCMGDTLAHLGSLQEIGAFLAALRASLEPRARLVLTFRDQQRALTGTDRILPVASDDDFHFVCLLDYDEDVITVTDIVHYRAVSGWNMEKSAYCKVRLRQPVVVEMLKDAGYVVLVEEMTRGLVTIVAQND
ncbi:class I SAM-dependent methyltransferase [Solidesulfovibrio carbinolicus]|uniref:Class I SAM-dependent methyltransferase n=1 Tax=Solidesulfovibrio carbinolicus TaxID=296842 RepID=A0A4P6HRP2_9BACT|nr:class I SAM-dependent methyltransferase [Solidesulfovibrio carbinolicus]QAZ67978.1 class I SAM-dependent methyltransferase [Solidesulfovibrio carbinolicus]